jgi:hypothetical protein
MSLALDPWLWQPGVFVGQEIPVLRAVTRLYRITALKTGIFRWDGIPRPGVADDRRILRK